MLEVEAIAAEIFYAGDIEGRPASYAHVLRIFIVINFLLRLHQNAVPQCPKFGNIFSAFIVDERYIFVCRYVEPFRSYALLIDGGSAKCLRNLRFSRQHF